jgi:hypothetical protein
MGVFQILSELAPVDRPAVIARQRTEFSATFRAARCAFGAAAVTLIVGCSGGPGRVPAADVDVDEFAGSLVDAYDGDADAQLSGADLEKAAFLKGCLERYDNNGDGRYSVAEIAENLRRVFDGKLGLMGASCRVTHNGRPLEGAIVYFVPLEGLEDELPVAGAVTQRNGVGVLSVRPEDLPKNAPKVGDMMRPGLYFIEVTHPTLKIPEQYNVKTTLGQEVTPATAGDAYELALKF